MHKITSLKVNTLLPYNNNFDTKEIKLDWAVFTIGPLLLLHLDGELLPSDFLILHKSFVLVAQSALLASSRFESEEFSTPLQNQGQPTDLRGQHQAEGSPLGI